MRQGGDRRSVVAFPVLFGLLIACTIYTQTRVTVRILSPNAETGSIVYGHSIYLSHATDGQRVSAATPHVIVYSEYNSSIQDMDALANDLFEGKLCERISINADSTRSVLERPRVVRIHFHCRALFEQSGLGTGNFISAIYALRIAAKAIGNTGTSIEFLCSDAQEEAANLILPWLTGVFPPGQGPQSSNEEPTLDKACSPYQSAPIGSALDDIKWEMRRLAVALVGIPFPGHPAEAWAKEDLWSRPSTGLHHQLPNPRSDSVPLIPNVELDDAVLHFRCGDLIFSNLSRFGFMKFGSYAKHLHPNTTSIGIATQSFQAGVHVRTADVDMKKKPQRCRQVVEAFVEYLEARFPRARITIRNGPDESIALSFARMVMAKQVVVGISSFGVFPAVASFGRSYIRDPDYIRAPNRWLLDPQFRERDQVTLIQEPRLTGRDCRQMWGADGSSVLDWLRS